MFIFSIFGKIFKKKESEKEEESKESKEAEEEFQKIEPKDTSLRNVPIEKEEKEMLKSELKPGPLTEKFFDLAPVREKKKEEKE
ncbi:MAG: hypothetical protein QXS48_04070 [Candidatus Aenigmatarchaeota archaeon]